MDITKFDLLELYSIDQYERSLVNVKKRNIKETAEKLKSYQEFIWNDISNEISNFIDYNTFLNEVGLTIKENLGGYYNTEIVEILFPNAQPIEVKIQQYEKDAFEFVDYSQDVNSKGCYFYTRNASETPTKSNLFPSFILALGVAYKSYRILKELTVKDSLVKVNRAWEGVTTCER